MFKDVTLTWKGSEHVVKSNRVMELIARLENHISIMDLANDQRPPFAKLSMAYAEALNFAGASVDPGEIYADLFSEEGGETAATAVTGLLMMMMPPERVEKVAAAAPKKKARRKAKAKA